MFEPWEFLALYEYGHGSKGVAVQWSPTTVGSRLGDAKSGKKPKNFHQPHIRPALSTR